jgi:hypothetical protein
MIYVPDPYAAVGNLSLNYATHILMTRGEGGIHPDVYKYGRDQAFVFHNVTDEGVLEKKRVYQCIPPSTFSRDW